MNLGPRKLTGFFEITGISQDKKCAVLEYTYDWNYLKSALFYFIERWKQNKEKPAKHPSPSSEVFSQDPALLTFLIPTHPQTDGTEEHMCQPLGVCIPNLFLSDPCPFPGDSVFISIKTQDHFFFFLLCQFLKPGRISAWRGTLQLNSELGK